MSFYHLDHLTQYNTNLAAVADDGASLSYAELNRSALAIIEPVSPRSLVFLLCENSLGNLAGYLGFLQRQAVSLLLDAALDRDLLNQLIANYRPAWLWLPERYQGEFTDYQAVLSQHGYTLLATGLAAYPLYQDLALLLTTSGSTGSSKLVRLSYDNLQANAAAIAQYLEISPDDRPITNLPMHYTYGLSVINSHLLCGATLLLTNKTLMQKEFWGFLKAQQATTLSGVPYTYEMLKKLRFFRMNLPSLNYLTQAGGKLSIELHREFAQYAHDTGKRFYVMYGQTEATARMSYLPADKALDKIGSMGIAIPGGSLSLVDEEGKEIAEPNETGELVYRGKNVSLGYAQSGNDLSKGDEHNGILYTGDMAQRDSDGYYYITGRKKRFIKLFGNRVNLDEAEQLVKTILPDCACAGQDDNMVIFITDKNQADNVRVHIAAKTGIHPRAFAVRVIDAIPKNEAGKTLYSELEV